MATIISVGANLYSFYSRGGSKLLKHWENLTYNRYYFIIVGAFVYLMHNTKPGQGRTHRTSQRSSRSGSRHAGSPQVKTGQRPHGRGRSNFPFQSRRPKQSFGGTRPQKRTFGSYIDPQRFINKAVSVEEVQYVPTHRFADFALLPEVKTAIARRGYELPTAIQDESIPHILFGKDIVGIADTGSGKTGAFLIPLIHKMANDSHERVLVVVPTRELAIQIEREFNALARPLRLEAAVCVGGANINPQIKALRRNPHMVIGTPGRLKDLIERGDLRLTHCGTIVLDEADRMLDMGFIADMRYLMGLMPSKRHTLFFSATLSPDIERLIGSFLSDPVRISVKTRDTSQNVEQDIVRIAKGSSKFDVLAELLERPDMRKVLIFGRTKHGVEKLSQMLHKHGIASDSIHGNKSHNQRQRSLKRFRDHEVKVLVATDVAARGLDIPGVSHVINFDLPNTHDDYVHRIGRTGRGTERGVALTFIEE